MKVNKNLINYNNQAYNHVTKKCTCFKANYIK